MFPGKPRSAGFADFVSTVLDDLARTLSPTTAPTQASSTPESPEERTARLLASPLPAIPAGLDCKDSESALVMRWRRGDLNPGELSDDHRQTLSYFCVRHQLADPMSLLVLHGPHNTMDLDQLRISKELSPENVKWLAQWSTLHGRPLALSLFQALMTQESAQAFAKRLQSNKNIAAVTLCRCPIGARGAKALSAALKSNSSLIELSLVACDLDHDSALHLGTALKTNTTLKQLTLHSNDFGDEGAKALAEGIRENRALRLLDLSANSIRVAGAHALGKALVRNTTLQALRLENNFLGNEGAAGIADLIKANHTIQTLHLRECAIGATGSTQIIAAIKGNPNFKELSLSAEISAESVDHLVAVLTSPKAKLHRLSLYKADIDKVQAQRIIEALEHNVSLAALDVAATTLDKDCIHALAKALRTNGSLSVIRLSHHQDSFDKESLIALADALSGNLSIQCFDLTGCDDTRYETQYAKISASLQRNQKLGRYLPKSGEAIHILNRYSPNPLPRDQIDYVVDFTIRYMALHSERYMSVLQNLSMV